MKDESNSGTCTLATDSGETSSTQEQNQNRCTKTESRLRSERKSGLALALAHAIAHKRAENRSNQLGGGGRRTEAKSGSRPSSRSRKKVSPARHAPDRERTSGKDRPEMNQAEERQHCSALESKEIDLVRAPGSNTDSKQICSPPLNRTRA
jgi:hypothetical protein